MNKFEIPTSEMMTEYKNILEPYWLDYINGFGTDGWCISLETSCFIYHLMKEIDPKYVVDTGSGFTSFIIRKFFDRRHIHTVEDDPNWLGVTYKFLQKHGASTHKMFITPDFREIYKDFQFDLIIHDNDAHVRAEMMDWVFTHTKYALVDDLHSGYEWFLAEIRRCEEVHKPIIYDIKDLTFDKFGRFAGFYEFSK